MNDEPTYIWHHAAHYRALLPIGLPRLGSMIAFSGKCKDSLRYADDADDAGRLRESRHYCRCPSASGQILLSVQRSLCHSHACSRDIFTASKMAAVMIASGRLPLGDAIFDTPSEPATMHFALHFSVVTAATAIHRAAAPDLMPRRRRTPHATAFV